jgi:fatty-acyl-CoA synthase
VVDSCKNTTVAGFQAFSESSSSACDLQALSADVIHTHPFVEDVHIIGVPDPYYGEELCAWVKVKKGRFLTTDDIKNHCRQRVARYKVPRYVKFVDSYPMTVTGKVQKFKMREASAAELQVEEPG